MAATAVAAAVAVVAGAAFWLSTAHRTRHATAAGTAERAAAAPPQAAGRTLRAAGALGAAVPGGDAAGA